MRQKGGFTVIEIVIVGSLMVLILGSFMLLDYFGHSERAKEALCLRNRKSVEEAESRYLLSEGVHSQNMYQLEEKGYLKDLPECPAGGLYAWKGFSEDDPLFRAVCVCSVHGSGYEESATSFIGADFEDGTFGSWETIGKAAIVGEDFGVFPEGEYAAYVDTNKNWWWAAETISNIEGFLGLDAGKLNDIKLFMPYTSGSAIKIEAENADLDNVKWNFMTDESACSYWYNDTAFISVTNTSTGKQEIYPLADTFSELTASDTKFSKETGWISLKGMEIDVDAGDIVGIGVLNSADTAVSSAILVDEAVY